MTQDLRSVVKAFDRREEEALAAHQAAINNLPYINLVNYPFVGEVLALIDEQTARDFQIVAFMKLGKTVRVASPDPFKDGLAEKMNQLGSKLGVTFEPHICSQASLDYALKLYPILAPKAQTKDKIEAAGTNQSNLLTINNLHDLQKAIEKVSTTELLETLFQGAVALQASDIHFEKLADGAQVRFRLDGKLLPIIIIPEKSYKAVLTRVKTAAKIKLDINKRAQDGRFSITVGEQTIDIRVNTAPSTYGETIVLRLLNYKSIISFEELDFNETTKTAIAQAVSKPSGLILFTGPTGSGKTTSLYAVLQMINHPEKKIITIEDPVEYRLSGIEQIQVDPPSGFDFPQALRSVLRQDPDVIMVGEIRDKETAEIAANASITGHLVLSTLHTTSAALAFSRLLQMGVLKYLLADAISLIVAQRLVRKICSICAGKGCDSCFTTGYRGRILIAEHLIPDKDIIELVRREASAGEFNEVFIAKGFKPMREDGMEKVARGLTTEKEVKATVY